MATRDPEPGVKTRRKFADVDAAGLADDIMRAIGGAPLSLLVSEEPDGFARVAVMPAGTEAAPVVAEARLLELADAHVRPASTVPDPLDVLVAALDGAKSVGDLKVALTGYATAEKKQRARPEKPAKPLKESRP